jgi:hypothetical protein
MPLRRPGLGVGPPTENRGDCVLRRSVPLRRSAPLHRGLPAKRRVPVRKKRFEPRRGPDRCPEYLAWIRTLGCVVCGRPPGSVLIEAAHTNALGPRGLGQKSTDFSAIPLCSGHHRQDRDSYHLLGEEPFLRAHAIDLEGIVRSLQDKFLKISCGPTKTGTMPGTI